MIWLGGLDLPNFVHFPVRFVEHFQGHEISGCGC
jgi:hypothetical protein